MAIPTEIGLNFTKISDYNISFDIPSTSTELIPSITQTANSVTNNALGYVILSAVWVILFWLFREQSPFAEFRYSSGRSMVIAFGICSVIGLSMLEAKFITSFIAVATMVVLYILTWIFIHAYENRE